MTDLITRLQESRRQYDQQRRLIADRARLEHRADAKLTETESIEFRRLSDNIRQLDERIEELREQHQREATATAAYGRAMGSGYSRGSAGYGSTVYTPESRSSYFADLINVSRQTATIDAKQRLEEYEREQRDLNRADGTGGVWSPPAFLYQDFAGVPRAGRVTADLLNRRPLPPGTDTIHIPKLVSGGSVQVQPSDNDPIAEQDPTDTSVVCPVRTIAGQVDVAIQLLDQSPVDLDSILMQDLLGAHSKTLDEQVLSGSGTAGQLTGLRNVSSIETVTWTSASPTAVELQRRIADAVSRMSTNLFKAPNVVIMHGRRWAWLLTQNDASSRPLVVPETYGRTTPWESSQEALRAAWGASPACRCTSTTTSRPT